MRTLKCDQSSFTDGFRQKQAVSQVDLQGAADLTSWTRPVRQNLHAGDPRQLHLEVALAVQEEISAGQSSTQNWLLPVCISSGQRTLAVSPVTGQNVLGRVAEHAR